MNILFIGDIYGSPGRDAVARALPKLRDRYAPDVIIANCENSAGGKGVNASIAGDLFDCGVHVLTGGNHSLYQRGCDELYETEQRLIRPANFPPGTPGRGWTVLNSDAGFPVAVLNICGRAFMQHFDDPFRCADDLVDQARAVTPIVILDFHAETTSEKVAMGWYLDGRVSAVLGTHTHIQTADERVLPKGAAYITDTGMTGPYHSVIGADKDAVMSTMLTLRHTRFDVAPPEDVRLCGVFFEVDPISGLARSIERVRVDLGNL